MPVSKARPRAPEFKTLKKAAGGAAAEAGQEALRVLAEERLKAHVEAVVSSAPPLTNEARNRLGLILRGQR